MNSTEKAFDIVSAEAVLFYGKWFNELYEEVSKHESVKVYVNRGARPDTELEFTAFSEEDNPDFFKGMEQEKTILVKMTKLVMNNADKTFYGSDYFYIDDELSFRRNLCSDERYTDILGNTLSWADLLCKNKTVLELLKKFLEEWQVISQAKEKIRKIKHDAELNEWRLKHGYIIDFSTDSHTAIGSHSV